MKVEKRIELVISWRVDLGFSMSMRECVGDYLWVNVTSGGSPDGWNFFGNTCEMFCVFFKF